MMDDYSDFVKAATLILLAAIVITALFYIVTIALPVILMAGIIYVVSVVIKEERDGH